MFSLDAGHIPPFSLPFTSDEQLLLQEDQFRASEMLMGSFTPVESPLCSNWTETLDIPCTAWLWKNALPSRVPLHPPWLRL